MSLKLWFGDERGYNATIEERTRDHKSCGLVMKEDITQRRTFRMPIGASCGLVMKEDITQRVQVLMQPQTRCGLVMKEDITQQTEICQSIRCVVVW